MTKLGLAPFYTECYNIIHVMNLQYAFMEKNMKNHRKIRALILFLVMVLLGGCGSKSKGNDSELVAGTPTDVSNQQESQQHQNNDNNISSEEISEERIKDENGFYVMDDYVVITAEVINIRTKPSTDAPVYKMLEVGNVLNRTGENDEWTRVVIDGSSFYAYSEFLQETEAPAGENPNVSQDNQEDIADPEQPVTRVVVIDPGNQASANFSVEPIGPSTDTTKQCATEGNVGASLGTKEYSLNLEYALLLKQELEGRGYTVVLTRENNNVDLSNKQRAMIANSNSADALIRIQMNYSSNAALTGAMALCMSPSSQYNSELFGDSKELSIRLLQGMIETTGADNHGVYETDAMTFINWSQVPVTILKVGFLSNSDEEAALTDDSYMQKVITGVANGLDYYFTK